MVDLLLELLFDVKVNYTLVQEKAESLRDFLKRPNVPGKFNLIIVNHRTRLDWMLMWMFLARTDSLFTLKIVLKGSLAAAPFFGWTMQTFRFLFLSRKWEQDKEHIERVVTYMKRTQESATFFIFPEGTDLSPSNVAKSQAFATERGLPLLRYVLNPRTTGLLALKNFIGVENIQYIYDVTMGYTDYEPELRPSEINLIDGRMPRCVHFLCSRYRFTRHGEDDGIPSDDDGFRKWVEQRFEDKEVLLSNFYRESPNGFTRKSVAAVCGSKKFISSHQTSSVATSRAVVRRVYDILCEMWEATILVSAIWIIPSVHLWVVVLFWNWNAWVWLWVGCMTCFYVAVTKKFGGVDKWLMY